MSIIKGTNKIVAGFGGTKRSIGEVYFSQSALATDNSGALPLFTGETIASANTIYPEFYNWILAHAELQCTTEEYEAALTTYGECAKYVIGNGSLRLPLIKNYIKAANTTEGIKNIEAGLPNITGDFNAGGVWTRYASGAFKVPTVEVGGDGPAGNGSSQTRYTFDASRSSAVYGKSDTVTPASTTLYPWVVAYTSAIPASTAQAAAFQQGLSGKADTNLGNIPSNYDYVVESKYPTAADPSWYRKYKSGWLEQGGLAKSNSDVTVTLLKPFADTNYSVQCTNRRLSTSDGWGWIFVLNMTTTSFMARACYAGGDTTDINAMWEAKGAGKKDIVHMYQYEATGPMGRVFVYADKPGTEYLDQEPAYSEPYDTDIQVGVMRSFGENDIYLESSDTSIVQSSQATYIGVYNE